MSEIPLEILPSKIWHFQKEAVSNKTECVYM